MSVNTSFIRTRSLRVPPPAGLKAVPSQASQQPPAGHAGPSSVTIFLRNLRLLNLDLLDDWPEITAITFSVKDSQQSLKKRVQCVEWALYQLFALWDSEETRNKLQPFFPPLEPLQSLNLRAALFRCLDQAKKSGLLGRDAVLRKTMLDECKGERLEEVLAVFSTAVLKKAIQGSDVDRLGREAIARRLATETLSYNNGEKMVLSTMILAHKVLLSNVLQAKNDSKANFNDFANLLKLNDRQVIRRQEQLKVSIEESGLMDPIPKEEARMLQDLTKKNWSGNNEWLESILHGGNRTEHGGLLATSYDTVWKHVEDGSIGELEYQSHPGLLEQLDARVKEQNHRLAKWQKFRKTLQKENPGTHKNNVPIPKGTRGIDLGFGAHETLQLSRSPAKSSSISAWQPLEEYSQLVENLKTELENVGNPRLLDNPPRNKFSVQDKIRRPVITTTAALGASLDSESELDSSSDTNTDEPSPGFENRGKMSLSQTPPSELGAKLRLSSSSIPAINEEEYEDKFQAMEYTPSSSVGRSVSTNSSMPPSSPPLSAKLQQSPESLSKTTTTIVPTSPLLTGSISAHSSTMPPPSHILQHNSPQASDILLSMSTTSPSPTKPRHVLSLAERTRLSMSRTSIAQLDDFDELPSLHLPAPKFRPRPSSIQNHPRIPEEEEESGGERRPAPPSTDSQQSRHDALIERTRLSMSNFATVTKNAQLERRSSIKVAARKKRMSYMPKEDVGLETDRLKLIEGTADADYETVFMSRPKIKTSPQSSPVKAWGSLGERRERDVGSLSPGGD